MGLFFKNKKSKKQLKAEKLDDAFSRVYNQIDDIDSWSDPKKLEHYILDSCEQIIASTKEMERQKKEYRLVTAYLNDIKTIEDLNYDASRELKNTAMKIRELEASIAAARQVRYNLTEEQFEVISSDENQMPEIINRLLSDERYQSKVKKDMAYLEGEKSRWEIERDELKGQKKLLKQIGTVVLTSFTALMLLLFVIASSAQLDLSLLMIIVFFICAFFAFIIFIRQNSITKESRAALIRLNQNISLLNVQRMKYVNVTNGIEYQKDKYMVQSAAELQYIWEQYMDKIRDNQRFLKNNDDLEFYNAKLNRLLSNMNLKDVSIWHKQLNALINNTDMSECRHRLVVRRQKIRERIEDNKKNVQSERNEIDKLMLEHEHYIPEIQEIIKSVDKLCGTGPESSVS